MTTTVFLIDSGILIRHLRRDSRASLLLDHLSERGDVTASAISVFEVYRGSRTDMETAAARDLFTEVASKDIDAGIAEIGSEIARAHPGIFSTDRATADALIAGTAYTQHAILVTLNTRRFSRLRIPGLDLLLINQQAADWIPAPI